jgi:ribosomal protein S18 acetylase RimI-like enzyme
VRAWAGVVDSGVMTAVGVRAGTQSDVNEIARVHRLSRAWYYGKPADAEDGREELWAQLIAEPERVTHVAESDGSLVGFISATRVSGQASTLELTALYVLPEQAGAGVGSQLYEHFESERSDHEQGCLEVWSGNSRAITFYVNRGWIATTATRPGPDGKDFVTYRLPAATSSL